MSSYSVGDIVVGCGEQSNIDITGLTGTIVGVNNADRSYFGANKYDYAVEFDEYVPDFHRCYFGGKYHAEDGHGWFCDEDAIELLCATPAENIDLSDVMDLF